MTLTIQRQLVLDIAINMRYSSVQLFDIRAARAGAEDDSAAGEAAAGAAAAAPSALSVASAIIMIDFNEFPKETFNLRLTCNSVDIALSWARSDCDGVRVATGDVRLIQTFKASGKLT